MNPYYQIMHLITSLDVGGAEVMLSRLLKEVNQDRFKHRVICLTKMGVVGRKISSFGIKVTALGMPNGRISWSSLRRLSQLIKKEAPFVLQTWLYHADLIGLLLGKWHRVPHICWNIRCSYIDLARYRLSTRLVLKSCAILSSYPKVIISNSTEAVRFHSKLGYHNKSWHVIPNGIELEKFKPIHGAKQRLLDSLQIGKKPGQSLRDPGTGDAKEFPKIIGFVARFDPMKDHATFLSAALELLGLRSDIHFVLVGRDVTWENSFFVNRIPDHCRPHFHLLGERNDIEKIMPGFDIASLSSSGEGFPNVIAEAMACCIPCVVTDVGDCAELVGDLGVVVPPRDAHAMMIGWQTILKTSQKKRNGIGYNARKKIIDQYDITVIAERYKSLYQSLIEGDNTSHHQMDKE